jgi:hypothetical protein
MSTTKLQSDKIQQLGEITGLSDPSILKTCLEVPFYSNFPRNPNGTSTPP